MVIKLQIKSSSVSSTLLLIIIAAKLFEGTFLNREVFLVGS